MTKESRSLLCALLLGLAPAASYAQELAVVPVDLERYLGTWYDIAHLPFFFQNGCAATTATYSTGEGGTLAVLNRCLEDGLDGPVKRALGKAWLPDPMVTGKLKVQFFWPFSGDYWVFELGPDYEYAVVGSPDRKTLWIMSRSPKMDEARYQAILGRASALGFEVARLEKTLQP